MRKMRRTLVTKLDPVVVDPSTGDLCAVKRGDARVREETSEEGSSGSTDGVKGEAKGRNDGKDGAGDRIRRKSLPINSVVDLEKDLDAGGVLSRGQNGQWGGEGKKERRCLRWKRQR
jgi:hypothetical protein